MLEDDVEQYLAQISRVMKPGGRGLVTLFLINEESSALIADGNADPPYRKFAKYEQYTYISNPQVPEDIVGFDEEWLRRRLSVHGLTIEEPIHYGGWSGRQEHLSHQDIVIIRK